MCLFVVFATTAQDNANPAFTNRQGVHILPEQGDFALGFDALPVLNLFGGNGNFYQNTIFGKYFLDHDRALRAKLSFGVSNNAYKQSVANDQALFENPLNIDATVIDVRNEASHHVALSIGYEIRRGHGRVQGFFGGEVGLGLRGGNTKYSWANPMTELNQSPTSTVWEFQFVGNPSIRDVEAKLGNTFSVGLGGFLGAEYFIAPKLSIGAEISLAFWFNTTGQTETTKESWNQSTNRLETRHTRSHTLYNTAQHLSVSTIPGGSVYFMFHF